MSLQNPDQYGWSPEQIELGRKWVQVWEAAGIRLDKIKKDELRTADQGRAISLLLGPADYTVPPRKPKPTSGLIEQQRWFLKALRRD